jgi:peptidoglycan hydrolase CwlO-like protein
MAKVDVINRLQADKAALVAQKVQVDTDITNLQNQIQAKKDLKQQLNTDILKLTTDIQALKDGSLV